MVRVLLEGGAYREAVDLARSILDDSQSSDRFLGQLLLAEGLLHLGALEEAVQVRAELPESQDPLLTEQVNLLDARILIEKASYLECIQRFDRSLEVHAITRTEILLHLQVAQSQARLNLLAVSRNSFMWILRESEQAGWTEGIADGLMALALLDRAEGHWSRAQGLLARARELYRELGLARKFTQATLNLGLQRLWSGQLRFAEEMLREAAARAREISDPNVEATARMDLGLALTRLGRTGEARPELAMAIRLCGRRNRTRRLAIALEYTGELHLALGNYRRAGKSLHRALAIAEKIAPEGDIVPEVLRRLAEVELGLGNAERAKTLARDAAGRAEKSGDRYELATAWRVEGQVELALGDRQDARALYERALHILTDLGELFEHTRVEELIRLLSEGDVSEPNTRQGTAGRSRPRRAASLDLSDEALLAQLRQHEIIGRSQTLMRVLRRAALIAQHRIPILIQGETGTGKELLARVIHGLSPWADGPMVPFNCTTCPKDLLDAELFGHLRGAYTGASASRLGLVRAAEGGSLFLDEIGELPLESQGRLLRLLDSGEVRPLGSDQYVSVLTRFLSATNADLLDLVSQRRFRRDLFFRLSDAMLTLPPLRRRREDIPLLVDHFVLLARSSGMSGFAGFGRAALSAMTSYSWPGNIRQLRAEVMCIAAVTPAGGIVQEWRPHVRWTADCRRTITEAPQTSFDAEDPEQLRTLLARSHGQVSTLARALGLSRSRLYRLLSRHGISPDELREEPSGLQRPEASD